MSLSEAHSILDEIVRPINEKNGISAPADASVTLKSFVERVYLPVSTARWKMSTALNEINRIRAHIVTELGSRPVRLVTRAEMQTFLNTKGRVLSRGVVNRLRVRLRGIFDLAFAEGIIDRNPAAALFTPRQCQPPKEKRVLTADQFQKILAALDIREQVIARLATVEGMRPGEILALKLKDLDLAGCRISVRRRVYKGTIDTPKTPRSVRDIALSCGTVQLLARLLGQVAMMGSERWVFPRTSTMPMSRDNIWYRYFLPRLKPVGLQWATFQVMRRTFATRSREAGVDVHTRCSQMGNGVDVNENEYNVCQFDTRLEAVRRFESAFVRNPPEGDRT